MAVDWNAEVLGPCMDAFGSSYTYQSTYGQTFQITAIFDEAYIELTPMGRGGIASEAMSYGLPGSITAEMPVLGVQLSQFPVQPQQGDVVWIAADRPYRVKEVRLDGKGGAKLLLNGAW